MRVYNKLKRINYDLNTLHENVHKLREEAQTHCWTCGVEGMNAGQYFAECLIGVNRLRMRGEFNFFTFRDDVHKLLGSPIVLFSIPYNDEKDREIYHNIKNESIKDIIHFLKYLNICPECAQKFGVIDRIKAMIPNPTVEQLENMTVVISGLEPLFEELAEEKENKS